MMLSIAAGQEHSPITFKSYLPIFSIQLAGFALLIYIIWKFGVPSIKNAIKEKKHNQENFLKSLDEKIDNYNKKLSELQMQLNNIQNIIAERKKKREKEIEKIASAVEDEIKQMQEKILARLKLEEELEILKLKIFLIEFAKTKIFNYVKSNLSDKQLKDVQELYEQEFLTKLAQLSKNVEFVNKLKSL
jgi:F-type H+-transporting ATPase subunit delta